MAQDPPRLACEPGDTQPPARVDTSQRVAALRALMTTNAIDAYMVLSNDDHQVLIQSNYFKKYFEIQFKLFQH